MTDLTKSFREYQDSEEYFSSKEVKHLLVKYNLNIFRYVVLTSKHHEGYTLWPSKHAFGWNAKDVGPNRDLVKDLAEAVRNFTDMKFGLYHSLYEWFNPLYLEDKANNFTTNNFVRMKVIPDLYDLVNTFKPEVSHFKLEEFFFTSY